MVSQKHQFKMILWTMLVIIGLSFCLGSSMLEPPHLYRHRIAVAQAQLRQLSPAEPSAIRLPASIGDRLTTIQDSAAGRRVSNERLHRMSGAEFFPELTMDTYDVVLPCLASINLRAGLSEGSNAFVPKSVKQVRVRASQCDKSVNFDQMEISNQSNGFSATIFQPSKGEWLTDYISLTKDSSVIRFAFANSVGDAQTRDFVIKRAPALPR